MLESDGVRESAGAVRGVLGAAETGGISAAGAAASGGDSRAACEPDNVAGARERGGGVSGAQLRQRRVAGRPEQRDARCGGSLRAERDSVAEDGGGGVLRVRG